MKKQRSVRFTALMLEFINYYKSPRFDHERKKKLTITSYEVKYRNIREYLFESGNLGIAAEEFSIMHAKELYTHIKKVGGNNYCIRTIEFCKLVLNWGIAEEIIIVNKLFAYKLKKDRIACPVVLTPEEVFKIEKAVFETPTLNKIKDLFLFQCYTGFSYADLASVKQSHVIHNSKDGRYYIVKNREKNGCECVIPYFEKAKNIWERYNYQLPIYSNAKYNLYLKDIGDLLGIKKTIYTHTARKTFATLKLNEDGFSIEAVSKMSGHASVRTTEIFYAKVNLNLISSEVQRLGIR